MAGPNINSTSGSTGRVGQKPQLSAKEQLRQDKENEILQHLGVKDFNQLPTEAQGTLKQTLDDRSNNLEGVKTRAVAQLVQKSIARSEGRAFSPEAQPSGSINVPQDTAGFMKSNADGSHKLVGSMSQNADLKKLMSEVGVDSQSFGPEVQRTLSGAVGRDLGNQKNWGTFSKKLKESHLRDQPLGGVGQAAQLSGSGQSSGVSGTGAINQAADLGLKKTARNVNDASTVDATATPEGVMNNEAIRDPDAAVIRAQTSAKIHQIMDRAGLTADQQDKFAASLDKALKAGQTRGKNQTQKGWEIVRSSEYEMSGRKMPADKGSVGDTPETRDGVTSMAAGHLFNLAETKTGANLDRSEIQQLQSVLQDFTATSAEKAQSKAGVGAGSNTRSTHGTQSTSSARSQGSKSNGNAAKAAAHAQLEAMGIDPKDPVQSHVVKDVESAFAQVMNGAKDDGEIALRGIKWVERQVGDKTGVHSKHMEEALKDLPEDSPVPQAMKQFSLQQVAMCAGAGKEAYMQHINQGMGAPANGGGGVPPFGGTPVGGGFVPYGGGPAMPMGGGAPGAAYGSAEQQFSTNMRCLQCSMILNDPSLSMEDKIMYFLLIMAAGQDDDRMRKMKEIADLDAKDGAKQKAKQTKVNQRAAEKLGKADEAAEISEVDASKTAQEAAKSASGAAKTGGAKPAGAKPSEASEAKPSEAKPGQAAATQKKAAPTKQEAVQAQLDAENEVGDGGNPEGPKSKEILMMELKRITEMRSMLMTMVNEMLRKFNENVRNIWR